MTCEPFFLLKTPNFDTIYHVWKPNKSLNDNFFPIYFRAQWLQGLKFSSFLKRKCHMGLGRGSEKGKNSFDELLHLFHVLSKAVYPILWWTLCRLGNISGTLKRLDDEEALLSPKSIFYKLFLWLLGVFMKFKGTP